MNKNVLHQSSHVQQLMAAGGPNWWNINTTRPQNSPPPPQHSSVLALPPPNQVPQFPLSSMSAWNDTHQEPTYQSLSQLLIGGIISDEEKSALSHMQKLDILEEQFLQQEDSSNGSNFVDHVKQKNLANHYQVMSVSSPTSCVTSLSTSNMLDFSNIKDGRHPPPDRSSECNSTGNGGPAKRARLQSSSSTQSSPFKVRKEKLGDRITALHQLVSPFGKTDTASVLSEALGYIRFLQSQIEALSLPYLGSVSAANNSRQPQSESIEEAAPESRSQGMLGILTVPFTNLIIQSNFVFCLFKHIRRRRMLDSRIRWPLCSRRFLPCRKLGASFLYVRLLLMIH
ncbi:transcription factor bHLH68 [Heracleum sosnowskyi]|uniref:Transcription factor bHLH68 n=1 Tax=Heracleum sosnowskyi TaxID=360622 RepID=A0AAD8M073_9APIA|nr:transcription factor bHLH68 [Heracleum sosnowskyi]